MREDGYHPAQLLRRAAPVLALLGLAGAAPSAASADPGPAVPVDSSVPVDRAKMPTLPRAAIDEALAIGGSDIEARKVQSRMTVAVRINGAGPYRFVVDSGADTSVVGERIAQALKLPLGRRVILNSITDSQIVDRVLVDEIELGPTRVTDLELPVLKERDLGGEGMLGLDALTEQRLMLDFEKRTIAVDDARDPLPREDGVIVVTARLRKGQLILTEVRAGTVPIEAVVDTGSQITIGNTALRDRLLRRDPKSFKEIEISGVTGTVSKLQLARIARLKLGSVILHNVPVAFADVPPFEVFGIHERPSLLLGTDIMETFRRVSLDFRHRKVRFQLRKCRDSAALRNASASYLTIITAGADTACAR
ncbi:MAG: aspartyl protease family protein [Altererythrobacter sp.]|nr:aspartyl protease family protein [Altererythrobacter sp.]